MSESYVTVATDDFTALGCLVLCNSLKQTGTEKKISALVYPQVSLNLRSILEISCDYVFYTQDLFIPNVNENQLTAFDGFQKLKCWLLTNFTKCIFLESDVLVIENIDDLFERPELSAVADPRWPDYFDVGVFVYTPNPQTYLSFIDFISIHEVSDKSIQSLLNAFFSKWGIINMVNKIPFIYNCQLNSAFYTVTNALVHFGRSIKAARLGNSLFQMMEQDVPHDSNYDHWNQLYLRWMQIYNEMVKPSLRPNQVTTFVRTNVDYGEGRPVDNSSKNSRVESDFIHHLHNECSQKSEEVTNFVKTNDDYGGEKPVENSSENYGVESDFVGYVHNEYNQKCEVTNNTSTKIENTETTRTSEYPSDHGRNESGFQLDEHVTFHKKAEIDTNIPITVKDQVWPEYSNSSNQDNKQTLLIQYNLENNDFSDKSKHEIQNEENIVETDTNISSLILDPEELENIHRQQWERGEIDYMGIDCFQNILSKLISHIEQGENSNLNSEE